MWQGVGCVVLALEGRHSGTKGWELWFKALLTPVKISTLADLCLPARHEER